MEKNKLNIGKEEVRQLQGEIRTIDNTTGTESRTIEGYALLFNTLSYYLADEKLGYFFEKIDPKALDGILEYSDVFCLFNHQKDKVLARFCDGFGSLSLNIDEKGLKYSFEAPKTELGDEVLEGVKRLDIRNSSFCFTVGQDDWQLDANGNNVRTILKFDKIIDVSPVYKPAYQDTTVASRNLENIKNEFDLKTIELNKYYQEIENKIKKLKNK